MRRHQVSVILALTPLSLTSTMANLFSDIVHNDAHWGNPDPDYPTLLATVGGGAATNRALTKAALLSTAVNSPVGLAFVLSVEPDYIYVG